MSLLLASFLFYFIFYLFPLVFLALPGDSLQPCSHSRCQGLLHADTRCLEQSGENLFCAVLWTCLFNCVSSAICVLPQVMSCFKFGKCSLSVTPLCQKKHLISLSTGTASNVERYVCNVWRKTILLVLTRERLPAGHTKNQRFWLMFVSCTKSTIISQFSIKFNDWKVEVVGKAVAFIWYNQRHRTTHCSKLTQRERFPSQRFISKSRPLGSAAGWTISIFLLWSTSWLAAYIVSNSQAVLTLLIHVMRWWLTKKFKSRFGCLLKSQCQDFLLSWKLLEKIR